MTRPLITRWALALAVALPASVAAFLASGGALAQGDVCNRYRAELANFERGGGGRNFAALADRQRQELNRMIGYYQSLGCERGRFLIFGAPPSPECRSASDRIRAMEGNYARLVREAQGAGEQRRRALLAAIERHCAPVAARPRGLFDGLFGQPAPPPDAHERRVLPSDEGEQRTVRVGGGRPVCVRACDGFFFPLANAPEGRRSADDLCQALCPGTPTNLYFLPGDSDLSRAVSAQGQPYTSLANAFRYRTTFDESCSCRSGNQSWTQALRQAETMIAAKRGDVVVTAEKAEELSRPKETRESRAAQERVAQERVAQERVAQERGAAPPKPDDSEIRAAAETGAAAPTAGTDSSGITGPSLQGGRILGSAEGETREVVAGDGTRRTVRVIGTGPAPGAN